MWKSKTAPWGRLPGPCQHSGGLDDESFSVWHSGQEQSAVESLANADALGNHTCAGNGMKLSSWANVSGAKLRDSMMHRSGKSVRFV